MARKQWIEPDWWCRGATPKDHRVLPKRIILVRHAESEGNTDHFAYSHIPDPQICLVRAALHQSSSDVKIYHI